MEKETIDVLFEKQKGLCADCGTNMKTAGTYPLENRLVCSQCANKFFASKKPKPKAPKPEGNKITYSTEKKEKGLPFQDIYQWSSLLTSEGTGFEINFVWTPAMKGLLRSLAFLDRQYVGVIALQGAGKTEFKKQLVEELKNQFPEERIVSVKWGAFDFNDLLSNIDVQVALTKRFKREFERLFPDESSHIHATSDPTYRFNHYRKLLGKHANKIIEEYFIDEYGACKAFLIDLPDYSKNNPGKMNHDLSDIAERLEKMMGEDAEDVPVNVVIFIQKELFKGHFLFGKLKSFELKPFTPQQFIEFFKQKFGSIEPFTEEALFRIAQLSWGIWRRFKKYVGTCLEKWYALHLDQLHNDFARICYLVTLNDVEQWITLEQRMKDRELEMYDLFPRAPEKRKKAVMILEYLQKGPMLQTDLIKRFFGSGKPAEVACGRMLEKLELRDIDRFSEGHTKSVRLKEVEI